MQSQILYEDKDIIVVHKPSGIAVQSARIGQADVVSELKNYLAKTEGKGKPPYLGIIHRLDQPVEGVLVFAKNPKSAAELSRQLQGDVFCKEYLAVVCGKPEDGRHELVDYLDKKDNRAVICEKNAPDAKKAVLQYERVAARETECGVLALLEIYLRTGRFHQIRARLSHAGYPILGDSKYENEKSAGMSEGLGVRTTALCARRLQFLHPVTKKKMEYTVSPKNRAFALFEE